MGEIVPEFAIAKLQMQPGDVLVVRSPHHVSGQTAERLRAYVKAALPAGVEVLLMAGGLDLAVVTPPPAAPSPKLLELHVPIGVHLAPEHVRQIIERVVGHVHAGGVVQIIDR